MPLPGVVVLRLWSVHRQRERAQRGLPLIVHENLCDVKGFKKAILSLREALGSSAFSTAILSIPMNARAAGPYMTIGFSARKAVCSGTNSVVRKMIRCPTRKSTGMPQSITAVSGTYSMVEESWSFWMELSGGWVGYGERDRGGHVCTLNRDTIMALGPQALIRFLPAERRDGPHIMHGGFTPRLA